MVATEIMQLSGVKLIPKFGTFEENVKNNLKILAIKAVYIALFSLLIFPIQPDYERGHVEILQNFDHFNLTFPPTNLEACLLYNFQPFHTDVTFLYFHSFERLHLKGSDIGNPSMML